MPPLHLPTLPAESGPILGWGAAAAIAAAWAATSALQRASARRLESLLRDDSREPVEGTRLPLLDRVAAAAMRRVRIERERHQLLGDRMGEIERVLRATPIAVLSLDHLQRVVSMNPAAERLLGLDERTARGRLLQECVRLPGLNRAVSSALADGGRAEGELELGLDAPREVQFSCEPLHAEGAPPGLVVSLVDVTRMRRLESMRSEFAANVSHELRTPITNIKGYVETLLQVGVEDSAQVRRFLEIVHRNTVRLSGIVEDILALAYLEEPEARRTIARAPCDVSEIVAQVLEDLGTAANVRSIRCCADVSPGLAVLANRSLAEQAVANLVSNAIKYAPEGTAVAVRAASQGGMVRISVEDEGPGIAQRHLPRLFERFYRVDRARSRSQGGTGLGLSIVKHIATVHGGEVDVESRVGSGSRFSITLPAAPAAAPSDGPRSVAERDAGVGGPEGTAPRASAPHPSLGTKA